MLFCYLSCCNEIINRYALFVGTTDLTDPTSTSTPTPTSVTPLRISSEVAKSRLETGRASTDSFYPVYDSCRDQDYKLNEKDLSSHT